MVDLEKLKGEIKAHLRLAIEKLNTISPNYMVSGRIEENIVEICFALEDMMPEVKSIKEEE